MDTLDKYTESHAVIWAADGVTYLAEEARPAYATRYIRADIYEEVLEELYNLYPDDIDPLNPFDSDDADDLEDYHADLP